MRLSNLAPLSTFALLGALQGNATAQFAEDESPWYLEFGVGLSSVPEADGVAGGELNYDEGYLLRGGIGRELFDLRDDGKLSFAAELEWAYLQNEFDGSDFASILTSEPEKLSLNAVMINGLFDWEMSDTVSFEFGAGVGLATSIDFGTLEDQFSKFQNDDDSVAAFQFRAGFSYQLGGYENFRFDAGYRYFVTEDIALTEDQPPGRTLDLEYTAHAFEVGMRWKIL